MAYDILGILYIYELDWSIKLIDLRWLESLMGELGGGKGDECRKDGNIGMSRNRDELLRDGKEDDYRKDGKNGISGGNGDELLRYAVAEAYALWLCLRSLFFGCDHESSLLL